MTTGRDRCRCHPGSKNRPWKVEPASAGALRPPPGRPAKAGLRKMRSAPIRFASARRGVGPGWTCRVSPGAMRADAAGPCAPSRGWRLCCSRGVGWASVGPARPSGWRRCAGATTALFSWTGATTVRSLGACRALAAGADPPEGRASCRGGTARWGCGAARGADVTRDAAAGGGCGAARGAAMCGAAARGADAARGAGDGWGAGAGCAAGGAPGGFAVAEVVAMPTARMRTAALCMLDCNMVPAPASSPGVNA